MTCPVNVPATRPLPVTFAGSTVSNATEGATPLDVEIESHDPPSDVVTTAFQLNVPPPALRISIGSEGGAVPLIAMEKESWPTTESNIAAVLGRTINVTGIVIPWL